MSNRDYAQPSDPYGIRAEYTNQSADTDVRGGGAEIAQSSSHDVRGNAVLESRSVPTQAEADAIGRQR